MNDNSPAEIRALLQQRGLAPTKRFGQNFLVQADVRAAIADVILSAARGRAGAVWEVGPGLGALTAELLQRGLTPVLFEIDQGFVAYLRERFGAETPMVVGDFQKSWREHLGEVGAANHPAVICGNLPYSAAGSIIGDLIEGGLSGVPMVFLVQKELAERLAAPVGVKSYGALSVLVQTHVLPRIVRLVPPSAFYPAPDVESAVIALTPLTNRGFSGTDDATRSLALRLAHTAFAQRRKQLGTTLVAYRDDLAAVGIERTERPERISPEQFLRLAAEVVARRGAQSGIT